MIFSDPFVKVAFNGRLLGQTATLKNTVNPDWSVEEGENNLRVFPLTIPRWREARDCRVDLEVFGASSDGQKTDFLGGKSISGEELHLLLTQPDLEQEDMAKGKGTGKDGWHWLDLRKGSGPTLAKAASTIQPKGEIAITVINSSTSGGGGTVQTEEEVNLDMQNTEPLVAQRLSIFEFTQNLNAANLLVKFISLCNIFVPENTRYLYLVFFFF